MTCSSKSTGISSALWRRSNYHLNGFASAVAGSDPPCRSCVDAMRAIPMSDTPISRVPLFSWLPPEELDALAATLQETTYPAGTILFHEGEYGDRFYMVLDGWIEIIKALGTDDERLISVRGAGEFVGEMSLLNGDGLRTASVRVRSAARALELTRDEFDRLLRRHPMMAYEMLRVL